MLLATRALFLLRQVKMSAVEKSFKYFLCAAHNIQLMLTLYQRDVDSTLCELLRLQVVLIQDYITTYREVFPIFCRPYVQYVNEADKLLGTPFNAGTYIQVCF